jgi:hypothetical protein
MAIGIETIAVNRYAPQGADAISLYSNGSAEGLTLAQLAISVCLQAASAYEGQSVVKMNILTRGAVKLDGAAQWMEKIANGSADWAQAKAYITSELGISDAALPDAINTYDKRMAAVKAVKEKIDALTQQQQRDMIDMQTLVNRRDVAYSTSSNVVRTLGASQEADAANF